MSTAVFEQVTISSVETGGGRKNPFSVKCHEPSGFADLIKDKPKSLHPKTTENSQTQKPDKNLQDESRVTEDKEIKATDLEEKAEENEAYIALEELVVVAPIINPVISQPTKIEAPSLNEEGSELEGESTQFTDAEENLPEEEFFASTVNSMSAKVELAEQGELIVSKISNEPLAKIADISVNSSDTTQKAIIATTNESNLVAPLGQNISQNSLVIADLSFEEQALIQSMKSLKLQGGFSNNFSNSIKSPNLTQEPSSNQFTSSKNLVAQSPEILLKSAIIESTSPSQASPVIIDNEVSKLIVNPNLLLADETKQGQLVLAKMNRAVETDSKISEITANGSKLSLEANKDFSDLEQDSREFSPKKQSQLDLLGGTLNVATEDLFQVSFRETASNLGSNNNRPKPDVQLSSAIKETLTVSNMAGKKEIVINLFPATLGSVKVEILSVLGEDGVRKIESIKIIAEKRETLDILEKSRMDLEKSLKEVTSTKEEAALQFEMNHQGKGSSGAYFSSLEERDSWMSNFAPLAGEESTVDLMHDTQNAGYITKDSINIKV
jgi:hypothetical protein